MTKALAQAVAERPDLVEVNDVAAQLADMQAGELIADLTKTQRVVVRRVIAQSIEQGWTEAALKKRLKEVVGLDPRSAIALENFRKGRVAAGLPPGRVERMTSAYAKRLLNARVTVIADHEVRTVLAHAQRFLWTQMQQNADLSPYAVRVTHTHPDEMRCAVCRSKNGQRNSLKHQDGGPPFHPRCRCWEEVVDKGIEKMAPSGGTYVPAPIGTLDERPHGRKCQCRKCKNKRHARMTGISKHLPGLHDQRTHGRRFPYRVLWSAANQSAHQRDDGKELLPGFHPAVVHDLERLRMSKNHAVRGFALGLIHAGNKFPHVAADIYEVNLDTNLPFDALAVTETRVMGHTILMNGPFAHKNWEVTQAAAMLPSGLRNDFTVGHQWMNLGIDPEDLSPEQMFGFLIGIHEFGHVVQTHYAAVYAGLHPGDWVDVEGIYYNPPGVQHAPQVSPYGINDAAERFAEWFVAWYMQINPQGQDLSRINNNGVLVENYLHQTMPFPQPHPSDEDALSKGQPLLLVPSTCPHSFEKSVAAWIALQVKHQRDRS